jgi:hypothetical protein
MSHSSISTPYEAVARYRNSQHLDNNPQIGKLISENRHDFENFVIMLSEKAQKLGVNDCDDMDVVVRLIEQAKDAFGRILIHSVSTVKGVKYADAVGRSCDTGLEELSKDLAQSFQQLIDERLKVMKVVVRLLSLDGAWKLLSPMHRSPIAVCSLVQCALWAQHPLCLPVAALATGRRHKKIALGEG